MFELFFQHLKFMFGILVVTISSIAPSSVNKLYHTDFQDTNHSIDRSEILNGAHFCNHVLLIIQPT